MSFTKLVLAVLSVVAVTALIVLFRSAPMPRSVLMLISWGSIIGLTGAGWALSRLGRVELGAVAITVQGFGVFSLMLGLAAGVKALLSGSMSLQSGMAAFAPMIEPIVDGFLGAALATVLVVFLRVSQGSDEARSESGRVTGGPMASGGVGMHDYAKVNAAIVALVAELERARVQAGGMADGLSKVTTLVNGLGTMLESLDRFFVEKV